MEEYTQITLDEWTQWKEDIRRKLAETANNFVYIGYRLKQIRDSGMFGGAADVFEFAQNEYGLGKSTVSRFIAINEKYSEGGNSLELKEEFKSFSSSKLSEMLTLPDNEIQLITEKTTIRTIRELKRFNEENPEAVQEEEKAAGAKEGAERTPLERCLIDFFESRKEMLNSVMKCLETDPPEYKQAAELMAPSGQTSHKKGLVFMFLYEWSEGVKYKLMTETEPAYLNWPDFLNIIYNIYGGCDTTNVWEDFYGKEEQEKELEEKAVPAQSNQGSEPVATSQQENEEAHESTEQEAAGSEAEKGSEESDKESVTDGQAAEGFGDNEGEKGASGVVVVHKVDDGRRAGNETRTEITERDMEAADAENKESREKEADNQESQEEQLPGQMTVEDYPEMLPAGYKKTENSGETTQNQTEEERYEEIIEQLTEKTAQQAEKISGALHEGRKELDEYRKIQAWVSILAADLEQLTKFVDLATPEEEEGEREDGE